MRTFDEMLSKQLQDEEFRKEYDAIQPEMDVIRAIVDARTSLNMTQKELAEAASLTQSVIARLETKKAMPQLDTLMKVAEALGCDLKLVET